MGGPPVLNSSSNGVIIPPDQSKKKLILEKVPNSKSLKSSQALCQSVFGGIKAYNRIDILEGIQTECGRSAFFEDQVGFIPESEFKVNFLDERTPTSIDVMFTGSQKRVAVECKFTEKEFGYCSQTKKGSSTGEPQCNGNYEIQGDRLNRCSLTEKNIRYWDYLSDLFDWDKNKDLLPCPFNYTYQLARNALAATVSKKKGLDPFQGHVLVIYDNRNPNFSYGGKAQKQWDFVNQSSKVCGLFRRSSW